MVYPDLVIKCGYFFCSSHIHFSINDNKIFYLNRKAVTAAKHSANNWYGQAAKNFGTTNFATVFNSLGEASYYSTFHDKAPTASEGVFTFGKTSAGFSAAAVRSLSSSKRQETKNIFAIDLGCIKTKKIDQQAINLKPNTNNAKNEINAKLARINYALNPKGKKIITELTFEIINNKNFTTEKQEITIPVINYSPQYNQFNPASNRYKNLSKASWVSTKAAYSIPYDLFKLKWYKT